jgi:glyoxylase-like metal-dependent hydrolase (beta-lactamase superfamily II)
MSADMMNALALAPPARTESVSFEATGLGDRSYLVHDGEVAVVVDPQRETERYVETAESLGVSITHVLETHVHNDYVSGGLGLARRLGATYGVPEGEDLAFARECTALGDGAEITTGSLTVSALATPGHTPHHLSYLLTGAAGTPSYVCTGGSVLVNGVGRTDLLGDERADELAQAQWRSVRRLLGRLDGGTRVLPTHGFGSFCSATPAGGAEAGDVTVGTERRRNPAVRAGLEEFVAALREDRPPVPSYYRYMAPANRRGPLDPLYRPVARLGPDDLDDWMATGSGWPRARSSLTCGPAGHLPPGTNRARSTSSWVAASPPTSAG